jgi:hypothetical protein
MASLLMIAVAVSVSVVIFMWSQGFLANSMQASGTVNEKSSMVLSAVTIESISANNLTKTMTITIRNIGIPTLHLSGITLQNNHLFGGEFSASCTLLKASACAITIPNLNFHFRDFYTVKVFTLEGASDTKTMFVEE